MVDRFRHLFDSLAEEVVVLDRELRIFYANPAWMRRFSLEPSEVLGRPCYQLLQRAGAPCALEICAAQQVLETGRPARMAGHAYTQHIPGPASALSASPVLTDSGDVQAVIQILHALPLENQTDVLRDNARLLESERTRAAQLRLLAELSKRVLSILDPEDLLDYATQAIQSQFGYYHVDVFLVGSVPNHHVVGM